MVGSGQNVARGVATASTEKNKKCTQVFLASRRSTKRAVKKCISMMRNLCISNMLAPVEQETAEWTGNRFLTNRTSQDATGI